MKNRYVWVSSVAAMATCVSTFAAVRPIANDYGKAPLTFEANAGQTDGQVKYLSRGVGYTLFLTGDNQAVLSLSKVTREGNKKSTAVRMSMVGSKAAAIRATDPQTTLSSYIQGADPAKWVSGVKHFGRIAYEGVYPGIDAVYYGNQRQLEYDFLVAPGADPRVIRLKFDGAERITTDSNGDLLLHTIGGGPAVRQLKPVVYQEIDGARRYVAANYKIRGTEATFSLGEYDRSRQLVIDPILVYSGYLGGAGVENGFATTLDSGGNLYVAGSTSSADFPLFGALGIQPGYRGGNYDAFVVKYGPNGGAIISSTFIGSAGEDQATAIGVDADGIVVAGQTDSSINFPLRNPIQGTFGGKRDVFLLKIANTGGLAYSTFLGGFEDDFANDLAIDSNNNAVLVGTTFSTNFWSVGGLQPSYAGGTTEGFVFKMNPAGQHVWSTYLGGNRSDSANSVAVGAGDHIYVTGSTSSTNFPRTVGVFQPNVSQTGSTDLNTDAFVTKINTNGATILYSTHLGGSSNDVGMAIAVNAAGNAVVTGDTTSQNFPTLGSLQGPPGNGDTFVTKLNPGGTGLIFSTYLAGGSTDSAADVGIDAAENIYVFGSTSSTNFPVNQPMRATLVGGSDLYISKFNAAGTTRLFSTYLGGTGSDTAGAMTVAANGTLYLTGSTSSIDYPRIGISETTVTGTQDAFVTVVSACDLTITPSSATFGPTTNLGSFTVNATNCPWTATVSDSSWIGITSTATGTNSGVISYTIQPNAGAARSGFISVSGVNYTINQTGLTSLNPQVVSLSPNSGSGLAQTFTARFSTANPGGAVIDRTYLLFNTTINGTGSCMVDYAPLTNTYRLINDNGATWSAPAVGGTNTTLSNSQCTLSLNGSTGTTATGTGVTETIVNYALTFNTGFAGLKTAFLLAASESSGLSSSWVNSGSWTVSNSGPVQGSVGVQSLVPTTGSGGIGTFTATFTHSGGANSHYLGYMLFLPTPNVVNYNATGTCLIEYNRISNGVRLIDNAGTGWLGPLEGHPVGTAVTLSNNYCSFNVQNVVASVNGAFMNVTVTVAFQNTLGPVLGTFLQAFDVNGNFTDMRQFGNWFLPGAPQLRVGPAVSSITPANAAGSTVSYTITSTHQNGWAALELINLRISDRIVGSPSCHVVYFPGSDTFNLVADNDALVLPVGVAPGTVAVIANSRCSISTAAASVVKAGTTLTVTVPVTFVPATFAGTKNVYGNAFGSPGLTSHWVQGATVTVQ